MTVDKDKGKELPEFIKDSDFGSFVDDVVNDGETLIYQATSKQDMNRVHQRLNRYKNRRIVYDQQKLEKPVSPYQSIVMKKDPEKFLIYIMFYNQDERFVYKKLPDGETLKVPAGLFSKWRFDQDHPDFWDKILPSTGCQDEFEYLHYLLENYEKMKAEEAEMKKAKEKTQEDDPTLDQEKPLF